MKYLKLLFFSALTLSSFFPTMYAANQTNDIMVIWGSVMALLAIFGGLAGIGITLID